jgi:hypothetical protein
MTIHSAADHGYRSEPIPPSVCIGDTFRLRCALGIYEARVLRPHRDSGYFETVFVQWVTDVPSFRQSAVGGIQIMHRNDILKAMRA